MAGAATVELPSGLADAVADVYREVFTAPPWNEPAEAVAAFRSRLTVDAGRPGFTLVTAASGPPPVTVYRGPPPVTAGTGPAATRPLAGFGTAFRSPAPWRTERAYAQVLAHLGPARVGELLIGGLEVDELAVRPAARGAGLGRRILAELTAAAPDGRAWLLTARYARSTVDFYRRAGWREVPRRPGSTEPIVVFLSPGHPGDARV